MFEKLVFNMGTAEVRREMLYGREHYVVPGVMMVEGVHTGSDGPGYYPEDENERVAPLWNHMPIVVYHPEGVSARTLDVLKARGVGIVLNSRWVKDAKKNPFEAWIDIEQAKRVDDRIITAIEKREPIEVSTGLYLSQDKTNGVWNGEKYEWVARNQSPDHLAILPDQVGACSRKDGCGLLTNKDGSQKDGSSPTPPTTNCGCGGNQNPVSSPEKENKTMFDKKAHVDALIKNGQVDEAERARFEAMDENVLKLIKVVSPPAPAAVPPVVPVPAPVVNANPVQVPVIVPQPTAMTPDQWLALAPPGVKEVWNEGALALNAEKEKLVTKITGAKGNTFPKEYLMGLPVVNLRQIASLIPDAPTANGGFGPSTSLANPVSYFGAAGAPIANAAEDEEMKEPLALPTLNFGDKK